jgi:hypothetical protein
MALTGVTMLSSAACICMVLIADGRLRSAASGQVSVSTLTPEWCFFASWSMTAAYRRSMSACACSLWASMTFWSNVGDETTTGLCGVLVPESFLNFRNHEDAERADRGGEAREGVLIADRTVFWSSSSSALGGSSAFRLILLPTVRRSTPQTSTVKT